MQALLSFEQAPPIAAPFRFFLTAPLFALLAGGLILAAGGDLWVTRWAPATLALTHLVTLGFLAQIMIGALIQILPVVAGANLRWPLPVARVVHALYNLGVLALTAGFLGLFPGAFPLAAALLFGAFALFLASAGDALAGVPNTSPTITGLKLALPALGATALLGGALLGVLHWQWSLPLVRLTDLHAGWALGGWGVGLLAAVSLVVVPMFQLTPPYPAWFVRLLAPALLAFPLTWSFAEAAGIDWLADLAAVGLVGTVAAYCAMTLWLQRRTKRPRFDVTQRLWQGGMLSGLAACALWSLAHSVPAVAAWPAWPLLFGALVLGGGFMSVIVGMLYKIVPFLVWLHLQNRGRGKVVAPNMRKILADPVMERQMQAHFAACALLAAAAVWPAFFTYPAGLALIVASLWLGWNLLQALGVYRAHLRLIAARLAEAAGQGSPAGFPGAVLPR